MRSKKGHGKKGPIALWANNHGPKKKFEFFWKGHGQSSKRAGGCVHAVRVRAYVRKGHHAYAYARYHPSVGEDPEGQLPHNSYSPIFESSIVY